MPVRQMHPHELPEVRKMMGSLVPAEPDYDFSNEHVLVWTNEQGALGGFISVSLRPWAEGCESMPVPYIEGWWVAPQLRRQGVGSALLGAVEDWCRTNGYTELASDAEIENFVSREAHAALGFEPVCSIELFRKRLV